MVITMFKSYVMKDRILYLEIDVNYEFGDNKKENKSIIESIKEYISKMNINNNFKKILITCSGIIIGSIIFLSNDNKIIENNIKYVPNLNNDTAIIYKENDIEDKLEEDIVENTNEIVNDDIVTAINTKNQVNNTQITSNETTSNIENTNQSNITEPSVQQETMISVRRSNGSTITIGLEDYVIGVIAAEMPASFNNEALKAQAVVSRTYALKTKATGKTLTDTVSTQAYIDENGMRNKWGASYDTYYNKIKNAVQSTSGEYLTYNGDYIEALYHSTNNGKTESSSDVFGNYYPYLISVSSEFDKSASSYLRTTSMDINTLSSKLGIDLVNNSIIEVLSYTDGSNIKEINIGGKTFTGRNVRETLGLRSADFDINIDVNIVNITTRGFGHGVGMSQYGANGMANAGYSYQDILSHYYPGTILRK